MAPSDDVDAGLVAEHRPYPSLLGRDGGEGGHRVELAEPGGGIKQVASRGRNAPAELSEESVLARHHRALRVEHQRFLFLERRGDVALAVDQRLLAHILRWDRFPVRVADLDVIAEHLVEADLQGPDPGALSLRLLEAADPVAGRARAGPNPIQLGVKPRPKDPTILERAGQLIQEGVGQGARHLLE